MPPKQKTLSPVKPNAGISAAYQKRLDALVDEMHASLVYWLGAAYKAKPPLIAADDKRKYRGTPSAVMRRVMRALSKRWRKRFDVAAVELAEHFSKAIADRSDRALAASLRKAGISVAFKPTAAMNDALQASIGENVALIKSIGDQHLAEVEGLVLRSVSVGRDIGTLGKELEKRYGITKRRASLIARNQNQLATATMQRARYVELGIKEAIWCHSAGGKEPRPSHVEAGRKRLRYDVAEGALIDGEYIQPGEKINCRCFAKPVIEGF